MQKNRFDVEQYASWSHLCARRAHDKLARGLCGQTDD